MSCTPDSFDRSLSPSDESRFVPHSSIFGASSVIESHFPSTPQMKCEIEPNLVADEDDKNEIVGATICFTPQSSPRASPGAEAMMNSSANETDYIGSIGELRQEMGSSAMHIASSLDDRSTTEYELLDGIESKGSIDVEDLELDVDDADLFIDATKATKNNNGTDNAALEMLIASPPSSLPSLDSNYGGGAKNPPKTPVPVFTEKNSEHLQYSDERTTFSRMTNSMLSHMAMLGKEDAVTVGNEGAVSKASSSPKVDDAALGTLKSLQAFWESRVLGEATMETEEAKGSPTPTSSESIQQEMNLPVDASNSAIGLDGQNSGTSSQAPLPKLSKASLLSSVSLTIWLWVQSLALLCAFSAKKVIEHICRALSRSIISTAAEPTYSTMDNQSCDDVNLEELGGSACRNLNTLFSDDNASIEKKSSLEVPDELVHTFEDDNKSQRNSMINNWKIRGASAILLFFLALLLSRFYGSAVTMVSNAFREHVCFTTNATTFDSIPEWEINLVPTDIIQPDAHSSLSIPLALMAAVAIAFLSLYVRKLDIFKSSMKKEAKNLHGLWTAEEHEQFIKGYQQHGSKWKLVAQLIPTRTHEQVKSHGIHWKKIGSPDTMKRSKKMTIDTTPQPLASATQKETTPKVSNTMGREEQLARAREYARQLGVHSVVKETTIKKSSTHPGVLCEELGVVGHCMFQN